MKIGLLLLFLCIFAAAEELNQIRTYFGQLQSEFFVSLGHSSALSALVAHELKSWKGLYLLSDAASLSYSLSTDSHNQALLVGSSLGQICAAYFPKTPKLLVVGNSKAQLTLLGTNDWNNAQCLPQMILVEGEGVVEAEKMLKEKGYELIVSKGGVGTFGKSSELGVINHRKNEFEVANRLGTTPIFIREEQLAAIYASLLPGEKITEEEKARPKKVHLHQTRYRLVSLPDVIEESRSLGGVDRPIVVLNFLGKQNQLYIGTNNFTVTDTLIGGSLFKRVTLASSDRWQDVYVLLNDGSKWLQMLGVDGNLFYEKDSDYNNILAFKNRCYHFQDAVKVVIRDNTYSYPIDPTTYGNLDRPLKAVMHVSPIPESPKPEDLRPLYATISGVLIVLLVVGLVVKRKCLKKAENYVNIKRDPASNSLCHADNEDETVESLP